MSAWDDAIHAGDLGGERDPAAVCCPRCDRWVLEFEGDTGLCAICAEADDVAREAHSEAPRVGEGGETR